MPNAKTIKIGENVFEITDPLNIQPGAVDLIVESRLAGQVVALSFATVITDGDGAPEARICGRIRLPLPNAMDLRNMLDELLAQAMPGKEKAN